MHGGTGERIQDGGRKTVPATRLPPPIFHPLPQRPTAAKSPSCEDFLFLFLPFATAPSAAVCWSCSSAAVAAAVHDRLSSATAPVPCCKSFAQHPFVVKEAALCFVCG